MCLNGHVTNDSVEDSPEFCKDHCEKCGEETIQSCPNCSTPIKGAYHVKYFPSMYSTPSHCYKCGKPFPWIERKTNAAKELAKEIDNFGNDDIDVFSANIDDLLTDNPNTQVAAIRIKKLLVKAGKPVADALYKLLVDVMSETARKTIWPES